MNPHLSTRIQRLLPLALMVICTAIALGAYLQALHYPFSSDDDGYLTDNSRLLGLPFLQLWRLFTEPYNSAFEFLPLRELSYWFDLNLFGLTPAAFRIHNIVLYLLSLPLVYGATLGIWRYFRPVDISGAPWAAAAVTALFALHPTLVEPVVWISGRKYMLPNFFSLLALWFALNVKRDHGFFAPYAAAALGAFLAVMLSKATYVPVAAIITLLWVLFWRDLPASRRHPVLLLWPGAILLLAAIFTLIFIANGGGLAGMKKIPFYFGIETLTRTLAVLGWLARLAISPENRHFFYPIFGEGFSAMVAVGAVTVVAAGWGALAMLRHRSLEGFAAVVFLLLCLPYLHLVPYSPPSLISDRFLSLAVWPATLLLVALTWRLKPVPRIVLLLVVAL
ncbi:MAG: hypothetical protein Q7S51_09830, partial [Gallionellaceae bacterium]|nr:hypothetical protein [Gallionellaceae bacterium]